jgi:ribosome-binding protein aMBF1 (putative translation factor)
MKAMTFNELLKHRGVCQVPLSDALGVKQPSVSRWARGESLPRIQLIPKIERILKAKCDLRAFSMRRLKFSVGR